jgi:hypothetical protein
LLAATVLAAATTFFIGKHDLQVADVRRSKTTTAGPSYWPGPNYWIEPSPSNVTQYTYDARGNLLSATTETLETQWEDVAVHSWLLIGFERARLTQSGEKNSHRDQQQLEKLRVQETVALEHFPSTPSALDRYLAEGISYTYTLPDEPVDNGKSAQMRAAVTSPAKPSSPEQSKDLSPAFWISLCTALTATIAMVSTALLGWRADKRSLRELELKISEFERKSSQDNGAQLGDDALAS